MTRSIKVIPAFALGAGMAWSVEKAEARDSASSNNPEQEKRSCKAAFDIPPVEDAASNAWKSGAKAVPPFVAEKNRTDDPATGAASGDNEAVSVKEEEVERGVDERGTNGGGAGGTKGDGVAVAARRSGTGAVEGHAPVNALAFGRGDSDSDGGDGTDTGGTTGAGPGNDAVDREGAAKGTGCSGTSTEGTAAGWSGGAEDGGNDNASVDRTAGTINATEAAGAEMANGFHSAKGTTGAEKEDIVVRSPFPPSSSRNIVSSSVGSPAEIGHSTSASAASGKASGPVDVGASAAAVPFAVHAGPTLITAAHPAIPIQRNRGSFRRMTVTP